MEITSLNQLDLVNGIYSYADYLVWKIKERVELLKGKISWDVRFPQKRESQVYTVVQPDLCVVCDFEKIDSKGYVGAPDLVVEILSI